ncbi:MAG: VOC family protein [Phycisphaerae bacterium]|nr:VOC family protein [Phycisphaerae bacterium]
MSTQATTVASPKGERIEHGVCWNELHTRDEAGAARFYPAVVGWKAHACPSVPGGMKYTEWVRRDGAHIGGMAAMPAGVPKEVPANWMIYINVPDVDACCAKATSLGGRVIKSGFDVPNVGRLAVIADPTGAVFSVIKGVGDCGKRVPQDATGSFCWEELLTSDPAAVRRFYGSLFGWKTSVMSFPDFEYTLFWLKDGDPEKKQGCIGGMMKIKAEWGNVPPNWLTYIAVDDVDATAAKATKEGGTLCAPPMDIPNVGRFAIVTDPGGATFALFKSQHG